MIAVALVLALVVIAVLTVVWQLAERTIRALNRWVTRLQGRIGSQRAEITALAVKVRHLEERNQKLRAELDRMATTAALSDEPPARCRWSDQTLAEINALPTTSPEDNR